MMRPGVHIDARARSPRASRARGGDLPAPTPRAMPMNVWNSSVQSLGRRRELDRSRDEDRRSDDNFF
jgi:hypothetical protein